MTLKLRDKAYYWLLRTLGLFSGLMRFDWRAEWRDYLTHRCVHDWRYADSPYIYAVCIRCGKVQGP